MHIFMRIESTNKCINENCSLNQDYEIQLFINGFQKNQQKKKTEKREKKMSSLLP